MKLWPALLGAIALAASGPSLAQTRGSSANDLFVDGFNLLHVGDVAGAEAKFQAGLKRDPSNAMAFFFLGEAYRSEGRSSEAATAYQQSLTLAPTGPVAGRARVQLAAVTPPPPLPSVAAPATPPPAGAQASSASSLFTDGFSQLRAGDSVGAAAKFQAGLKLDPTNAMAFFYLGEAYRAQGRTGDAASAYQHSLKLNASSPIAARAQSQLALLTTPAPAAEPVTTKTPAPVPAAALVLPSPPPPPSPSAPPPPPPVTLPPRPTLAPIPAVQLPACFTNERERNAFHDATYQPAMTVASANNDAAKAYLDRLLAMHAQFMKDGNFNAANTVTYEAVTYQLIAQAAFKASSDYAAMFDTMMGVPLGSCH